MEFGWFNMELPIYQPQSVAPLGSLAYFLQTFCPQFIAQVKLHMHTALQKQITLCEAVYTLVSISHLIKNALRRRNIFSAKTELKFSQIWFFFQIFAIFFNLFYFFWFANFIIDSFTSDHGCYFCNLFKFVPFMNNLCYNSFGFFNAF